MKLFAAVAIAIAIAIAIVILNSKCGASLVLLFKLVRCKYLGFWVSMFVCAKIWSGGNLEFNKMEYNIVIAK